MSQILKTLFLVSVLLFLTACSGIGPLQMDLMPPPDIYDQKTFNPFVGKSPETALTYRGVLYATDREAAKPNSFERYYLNERSRTLKLGVARLRLANAQLTWEEAKKISLDKNRKGKYPFEVEGINEEGYLDLLELLPEQRTDPGEYYKPAQKYTDLINEKLAISKRKDIYIYVHGYKVTFENPALVASQLWHYMAYDGVMIAYAWPSTPSRWAYLKDTETADGFARNFRIFLTYLARNTDAEKIHVIGYSAGTRLVLRAFEQLSLQYEGQSKAAIATQQRLGHLIVTASDVDREVFYAYLADGLQMMPEDMTVYMSVDDKALSISRLLTRRARLGQMWKDVPDGVVEFLNLDDNNVDLVDISGATDWDTGNGHAYFRNSPWVSSDILMSLLEDYTPAERGLIKNDKTGIWAFPDDYIERARETIVEKKTVEQAAAEAMSD
ncbi:MAG: alpha/beta hydrolase [Gammaproteobacteria bacterium]|nr:alpha/beta hydrolase [Gammaproteobacteria bacterium]